MKKFLFVCNFKMNSVAVEDYQNAFASNDSDNIIVCPNFCDIKQFAQLKLLHIELGAQDVSEYDCGAYTGQVSASMLKDSKVDYCIVGHSERKKYCFETLDQISAKAKNLLQKNITPIICVGEEILCKKEELQIDYSKKYVCAELSKILQNIDAKKVIVAYEPIWAIGSGKIPTIQHINAVCGAIRQNFGVNIVLYGGSFSLKNYQQIMDTDADGALIGGASLHAEEIAQMVNSTLKNN